uniref:Uncharacterized protein n=1 Tax=Oryza sativa subsp. japonica TaxID=39947 RepID=Q109F0_ORYSJ|nr:hypothetical protein LOC_Os10g36966 [Oryza sativa Japonica Group]
MASSFTSTSTWPEAGGAAASAGGRGGKQRASSGFRRGSLEELYGIDRTESDLFRE